MKQVIKRKVIVVLLAVSLACILWGLGVFLIGFEWASQGIRYTDEPEFSFFSGQALALGVVGCAFCGRFLYRDHKREKEKRDTLYLGASGQPINP